MVVGGASDVAGLISPARAFQTGDALSSPGASLSPSNCEVQSATLGRGVAAWPWERGGQGPPGGGGESGSRPL